MKVLIVTSQWPTPENPQYVPFIVRQVTFLRQAGVEVDVFPFAGGFSLRNYFSAWQALRTHLRTHQYDLLHAQFGNSALIALFPKRRPLVVTYHGSDLNGAFKPYPTVAGNIAKRLSQIVAFFADQVILVSPSLIRFLPRKDFAVIPEGVDPIIFVPMPQAEARQKLGLASDFQYALFVSGVKDNPIKRRWLAQAAVERAAVQIPSLRLLEASGVLPDEIPLYLNAADCLLLTSSSEGSPVIVKEALACNLPVVSVDVGDVRERIGHVPGCVVMANDAPETIAEGICTALRFEGQFDGRSAVSSLFGAEVAKRIMGVYERALARKTK